MNPVLVRRLLKSTAILCGLGMLALLFPLALGSAEAFATEEQDEKMRIAVACLLLLLAAAGGVSLIALKRMKKDKP